MKQQALQNKSDNREFILSKDPNKAMQEMMDTIDALRSVISDETKALNETDTERFMDLQDRKLFCARDYQDGMTQMLARKEEMKNANHKLKSKLELTRSEFAEVVKVNVEALERMREGTKRLGDRIIRVAREAAEKERQFIYSASGQMQTGNKSTMGINESV